MLMFLIKTIFQHQGPDVNSLNMFDCHLTCNSHMKLADFVQDNIKRTERTE